MSGVGCLNLHVGCFDLNVWRLAVGCLDLDVWILVWMFGCWMFGFWFGLLDVLMLDVGCWMLGEYLYVGSQQACSTSKSPA